MFFASDNWVGAHPLIAQSLADHAPGFATAYGDSSLDQTLADRFSEVFERPMSVYFVATGTAANSLALTSVSKPGGVVFAHPEAHIIADECGAVEYLSGSLRIAAVNSKEGGDFDVATEAGKMDPAKLEERIARYADVHGGRPSAVTVTQATECGTVYSLSELDAISAVAKRHNLPLHMDGARFANALVSLGCTPAEMTWKRGVDMLSFGGTKNGCWCAEAVVFFSPESSAAKEFMYVRKRAAQLFSKTRFISAQFERYLRDDLWLQLARHANGMAKELGARFEASPASRLLRQPQSNEVFVVLKKDVVAKAKEMGFHFYEWPTGDEVKLAADEELCRFVTSFATTDEHVRSLEELLPGGNALMN